MSDFDALMNDENHQVRWLIEEIDEHENDLTPSELAIFEDLWGQFESRGTLSPAQVDLLRTFKRRLEER